MWIRDIIFTSQVLNETRNNADGFAVAKYNRYVMDADYHFITILFF